MDTVDVHIVIGQCATNTTRAAVCIGSGLAPASFQPTTDAVHITTAIFSATVPKCVALLDVIECNLNTCGVRGRRARTRHDNRPAPIISGLPNTSVVRDIVRVTMLGLSLRLVAGAVRSTLSEHAVEPHVIETAMTAARPLSLGDSAIMLIGYDSLVAWQLTTR